MVLVPRWLSMNHNFLTFSTEIWKIRYFLTTLIFGSMTIMAPWFWCHTCIISLSNRHWPLHHIRSINRWLQVTSKTKYHTRWLQPQFFEQPGDKFYCVCPRFHTTLGAGNLEQTRKIKKSEQPLLSKSEMVSWDKWYVCAGGLEHRFN